MLRRRTRQEVQELTEQIVELKKQYKNQEIAEKLGINISYINDLMWKHNKKMKKANIADIVSGEFERMGALDPENSKNNREELEVIVYDPQTMQGIEMSVPVGLDNESIKRDVLERLEIAIKI